VADAFSRAGSDPVHSTIPEEPSLPGVVWRILPGLVFSTLVAVAGILVAGIAPASFPLPAMVVALILGVLFNTIARRPIFQDGLTFAVKKVLRVAVALLGIRIALGDVIALGFSSVLIVICSMAVTLLSGFLFARLLARPAGYGALAGAATAVCGASAALATATVVPNYPGKDADCAFVIIAANVLATLAMVAYPPLCALLGFDHQMTGLLFGATIHDVAQVVGAGYAVSDATGNVAAIVKLFRVLLLLPVVMMVGAYFSSGSAQERARVPVPVFALVFLLLCLVNSVFLAGATAMPSYLLLKGVLVEISTWGLLIAIGALGLITSPRAIASLGWRHLTVMAGTTATILIVVLVALLATHRPI
jgi:uncharacterized integral membrane protein (TIGR00698 family)